MLVMLHPVLFLTATLLLILLNEVHGSEIWNLFLVDTSKFNFAVCLDGSPAGFWFLPGYGSGAEKFVIHHEGGGYSCNLP